MADSPACDRVFAIAELLENILLKVHERDGKANCQWISSVKSLFTLQRVDKTFHNTIKGSIKLQRAMLLEFDEKDAEERPSGLDFFFNGDAPWHPIVPCIMHTLKKISVRGTNIKLLKLTLDKNATPSNSVVCDCTVTREDGEIVERGNGVPRKSLSAKYFHAQASWRKMKLFNLHQAILLDVFFLDESYTLGGYSSYIAANTEHQDLGDIHDAVDAAGTRSASEHLVAAAEYERVWSDFEYGWERAIEAGDLECEASRRLMKLKREHDNLAQDGRGCGGCSHCYEEILKGPPTLKALRDRYLSL